MAGGVASALADAPRRGGRALTGDFGLFEVDEFWLAPVVDELEPRALLLVEPVPRPARPLRRARDHRRALGRRRRRARRAHRARAQRRRPARRRPRPRPRRALLRRRRRRARVRRAPARGRLQALPPLRARLRRTRRSTSPTSAATLPELRQRGGRSRPSSRATSSCAGSAPRRSRSPRRRAAARVELPLPGLYNVYNALGAAALCLQLGAPLDAVVARAGGGRAGVRPRGDARPGGPPDLDPARQEPGGRERGAAHAVARGRASSTCSAC